jgi:hypothetical protein
MGLDTKTYWLTDRQSQLTLTLNHVKHLGLIFHKRITWILHTEIVEAGPFRTFIGGCFLFKIECLSADIKVTPMKHWSNQYWLMQIRTFWNCSACKTRLSAPLVIPRCTPVPELHMAFQVPYVYGYITKLCGQQAEVIQNNGNANVRDIGKGEARHRKYKRLKLGGGQAYGRSSN